MTEICPENACTGCSACVNSCPRQCIVMTPDTYGYIFPRISQTECIDCGLCAKICPANKESAKTLPQQAFAAWSLDADDRRTSTSGGAASVLATQVVAHDGGVAYGACNKGVRFSHIRVDDPRELSDLKGSKYVQSDIELNYAAAKKDLKDGRRVIFFGTPCQIAGLKSFLGRESELLTTVDIICHGVPSRQLLTDHLRTKCDLDRITKVTFRNEKEYALCIYSGSEILYDRPFPADRYQNAFQYALFFRPSCYQCHYASPGRVSDITIGDFWGLGGGTPFNHPKKKVSVILVNTEKGRQLLETCKEQLFLEQRDVEEAIAGNAQLQRPSVKHRYYDRFRQLYPKLGWRTAVNLSLTEFYVKNFIYRLLYNNPLFQSYLRRKHKAS